MSGALRPIDPRRRRWLRLFATAALALCVWGIIGFGSRLSAIEAEGSAGEAAYARIAEAARGGGRAEPLNLGLGSDPEAGGAVSVPDLGIDVSALRRAYPDAAAWLYGPDSPIDYPVMRATDYGHYLSRLPDGTRNANGSLFIDYNCAGDFSDGLTVIYGHHMKSGRMFGSLVGYKRQAYYEEHPYLYLYTEGGSYRLEPMYGCVIAAGSWRDRAFMYRENLPSLIAYAERNTTFTGASAYAQGDRVVVLSTCSYEFDGARYFVACKLVPEGAAESPTERPGALAAR